LFKYAERSEQNFPIEAGVHRAIYMTWKQFCYQTKEKVMISKFKLMVIAAVTALSIGVPTAAMAQSAWTTGTASNRAAAGYETPFNYSR
jgi:hypothetical protein